MEEKKLTKRKLQALQTKQNVFEAAKKLFKEKGMENVAIADIVKAAGVSTGTFYLYFQSKEQLISEIYMGEDQFFNSLPSKVTGSTCKERIISYFTKSNGHIEKTNGVEIMKQLYYPANPLMERGRNKEAKEPLLKIIREGQEAGELSDAVSAESLADYLYSLSSGLIFEWCLNNGAFPLRKRTKEFIELALKAL